MFANPIARPFVRRTFRRGSVLILVVALLVLMAAIGAGVLTTNSVDRYATQQNISVARTDALLDGLEHIATGVLVDDIQDANAPGPMQYRSPSSMSTYENWDSVDVVTTNISDTSNPAHIFPAQSDPWLSPRTPLYDSTIGPYWTAIGAPMVGHTYDSPIALDGSGNPQNKTTYDVRLRMAPSATVVSALAFGSYRDFPTWQLGSTRYIAGDADGDGIPDSGLFRFADEGEITYYAAVRIIDNAACVNLNTALSSRVDFDGAGVAIQNFATTPAGIGLDELLRSPKATAPASYTELTTEMQSLNAWRFNGQTYAGLGIKGGATSPLDDSGTARDDFRYWSLGDALWNDLGRRTENPGYAASGKRFRAIDPGDSAALAYRFCLSNPNATESLIERSNMLGASLQAPRSQPYKPTDAAAWFADNFNYGTGDTLSRRTIFTSISPISNLVPLKFGIDESAGTPSLANGMGTYALATGMGTVASGTSTWDPNVGTWLAMARKSNINTASFEELWRAYWSVMSSETLDANGRGKGAFGNAPCVTFTTGLAAPDYVNYTTTPYSNLFYGMQFTQPAANGDQNRDKFESDPNADNKMRMFRSPIRDTSAAKLRLSSRQTVYLRAALAAQNAIAMRSRRDPDDLDAGSAARALLIPDDNTLVSTRNSPDYKMTAYTIRRQPYLTEIYASTDVTKPPPAAAGANTQPYVAVELYWPYTDAKNLEGWKLKQVSRDPSTGVRTETDLFTFPAAAAFTANPAGTYLLLENYDVLNLTGAGPIVGRPESSRLPATGAATGVTSIYVPNLHQVISNATAGQELFLCDRSDVPIDSFDFTGLNPATGQAEVWHYARRTPTDVSDFPGNWRFVYPGRYDGSLATRRHQGTQAWTWDPTTTAVDPAIAAADSPRPTLGLPNASASYPQAFVIQVMNVDQPGPFRPKPTDIATSAAPFTSPFGTFARDADMLHVPFFGAYRVYNRSNQLIEIGAVPIDSAFCEDSDPYDDPVEVAPSFAPASTTNTPITAVEQIGRFIPICGNIGSYGATKTDAAGNVVNITYEDSRTVWAGYDDFPSTATIPEDSNGTYNSYRWRYRWAGALYDYLTVSAPHDDYLPNVKPINWDMANSAARKVPVAIVNGVKRPGDPGDAGLDTASTNPYGELKTASQGRININTAPWKVLAQIPWIPPGSPAGGHTNEEIAKLIVTYREGHDFVSAPFTVAITPEPFRTTVDVLRIEAFKDANRNLVGNPTRDPGVSDGDFSPITGTADGARHDYEEQMLLFSRISNLITTRSDSFTVYIEIQGWRNAGSMDLKKPPEMVVQKRRAFIADRSSVTPLGGQVNVVRVATE